MANPCIAIGPTLVTWPKLAFSIGPQMGKNLKIIYRRETTRKIPRKKISQFSMAFRSLPSVAKCRRRIFRCWSRKHGPLLVFCPNGPPAKSGPAVPFLLTQNARKTSLTALGISWKIATHMKSRSALGGVAIMHKFVYASGMSTNWINPSVAPGWKMASPR